MTRLRFVCVATGLTVASGIARADEPPTARRTLGQSLNAYNVRLGLESAAPVMFRDTSDMTLSETTVFLYGGHLAFSFGDERVDGHRLGLQVAYNTVARSPERSLAMISPMLTYETGRPFQLEVGLGWAIPSGTKGFAENYGGFASSATLRWSFRNPDAPSKVSVSLGLTGRMVAATSDFDYSSGFVGVDLDLGIHLGAQGGVR